ncbi:MAG: hypothetical protein ACLQOO_17590 [Terriglobia bacterium]
MRSQSVKLKEGQYVRHSEYGWGTILECDDQQTTVFFRSVGVRRLAASSATFAMVGGEVSRKKPAT